MARLHCDRTTDGSVTIARLDGQLALADAPVAWNSLVKLLADQPDALLVDLSGLTCEDGNALFVFGALARRASIWPGIPVILTTPDPRLRDEFARNGVDRVVAVCPDAGEARVLAHSAPTPPRLRQAMQPVPGAARQGRDLATEASLRWSFPELISPASVVASELVTNAVQHAQTPFELSLAHTPRYLHIAVRDDDPRPAVRQEGDVLSVSGRGLRIVERTALTWGSTPARDGKVVWATLTAAAR
jgi:anti-sigma regulatory factor (Ser/Thr protein kinase)